MKFTLFSTDISNKQIVLFFYIIKKRSNGMFEQTFFLFSAISELCSELSLCLCSSSYIVNEHVFANMLAVQCTAAYNIQYTVLEI